MCPKFVQNGSYSRDFVNLSLLLYSPVGEYKGMSHHIGPITTLDF